MVVKAFPFLQLPAEIRLSIYNLVLPYSEYHADVQWEKNDCPIVWYHGCGSLLFVNRQIHRETAEILYRDNLFAIYIRHPRKPRLPMNESRADAESFMLISWVDRAWANPRNPRLPYSLLKDHSKLHNIRRLYVSLPPFDDLLGVDVYMQKTSYAAFNGINAWIKKCWGFGGRPDEQERERMEYVHEIKGPVDEIGHLLQTLPRIDNLFLSLKTAEREISFAEYMITQLLALQNVKRVKASYISRYAMSRGCSPNPQPEGNPDYSLLQVIRHRLENTMHIEQKPCLPTNMDEMFQLLQSIRSWQQRDPTNLPIWIHAMAE